MADSKKSTRKKRWMRIGIGIGLAVLVLLAGVPVLGFGAAYHNVYRRHQQAFSLWQSRLPQHYRYQVSLEKLFIRQVILVEVLDGKMVVNRPMTSGLGGQEQQFSFTTLAPLSVSGQDDYIGAIFKAIDKATVFASTPAEFLARSNPMLYQQIEYRGWLTGGWERCNPAFPRVLYDEVYGYPTHITLQGLPCVASIDLGSAMSIWVEKFEVLP
jgi:hypothetical protein